MVLETSRYTFYTLGQHYLADSANQCCANFLSNTIPNNIGNSNCVVTHFLHIYKLHSMDYVGLAKPYIIVTMSGPAGPLELQRGPP